MVALSTIFRESFYGDTHNVPLGAFDVWMVRHFGVIIKTHSLPPSALLKHLADKQVFVLHHDPNVAAEAEGRHRRRNKWHARNQQQRDVSVHLVNKEFERWLKRASRLDARFPRFSTAALEADIAKYYGLSQDDSIYYQILRKSIERNPDHYESMR